MKSYYEIIENISKGDRNENHSLIAKQIITNYLNEKIVSQIELANSVFLSKSSITKFCKKIGLQGYRELVFHLRSEISSSIKKPELEIKPNKKNIIFQYFDSIENKLSTNQDLINELSEKIQNTKQLSIVASYSVQNITSYIKRLFFEMYIEVDSIEHISLFSTLKSRINSSSNVVFICIARDNETLNRIYDMVDNKENVIVITTEKQSNKFPRYKYKLVLESEDCFYNHAYRQILIETLFLNVYQNLK